MMAPPLCCPKCASPIRKESSAYVCNSCKASWPIRDGIPWFTDSGNYWGEITQREMNHVNIALRRGKKWKTALAEVTRRKRDQFPEPFSFITDASRCYWHYFLNLKKDAVVLDVGAGMGTIAEELARHYGHVIAVDVVPERLEFCKHRFREENLGNVTLLRADAHNLPFRKNSFDLIVMNGVLEWTAEGRTGSPRRIQESVLKKMHSLLKPGGILYVGIENRLCYRQFMGRFDPHVNVPFVTILPRFLASMLTWIVLQKPYRTYIYSMWGYERLFRDAGFGTLEFYNAIPDYNVPTYMLPVSSNYPYSAFPGLALHDVPRPLRRVVRILARTGILKYILPAYLIFARK